jgi:hypothetical protein
VRGVQQASRHAEVNQENPTGFEPNDQILAATIESCDALTLELGGDGERLEGADEPWVADLDTLERAADHVRLERDADRLDLR